MTKFIELTVIKSRNKGKLTINANNILQFYTVEPNNTGAKTKITIFNGTEIREIYVRESYDDILRALEVKQIFGSDDGQQTNERPKGSTWAL